MELQEEFAQLHLDRSVSKKHRPKERRCLRLSISFAPSLSLCRGAAG
jgi:hypothetical protein